MKWRVVILHLILVVILSACEAAMNAPSSSADLEGDAKRAAFPQYQYVVKPGDCWTYDNARALNGIAPDVLMPGATNDYVYVNGALIFIRYESVRQLRDKTICADHRMTPAEAITWRVELSPVSDHWIGVMR